MFWKTLGRMIVIAFAFLISIFAASAVFLTLGLEQLTHAINGTSDDGSSVVIIFDVFANAITLLPVLTLVPALTIVIIGEVARIRSFLYYVVGGGAALIATAVLAQFSAMHSASTNADMVIWPIFATAGFAGGLVYWMIAGRNA